MALTRSRLVRILLATVGLVVIVGLGTALGFYLAFLRDLPELHSLDDYDPPLASRVVDRDGALIGEPRHDPEQLQNQRSPAIPPRRGGGATPVTGEPRRRLCLHYFHPCSFPAFQLFSFCTV